MGHYTGWWDGTKILKYPTIKKSVFNIIRVTIAWRRAQRQKLLNSLLIKNLTKRASDRGPVGGSVGREQALTAGDEILSINILSGWPWGGWRMREGSYTLIN